MQMELNQRDEKKNKTCKMLMQLCSFGCFQFYSNFNLDGANEKSNMLLIEQKFYCGK